MLIVLSHLLMHVFKQLFDMEMITLGVDRDVSTAVLVVFSRR